LLSPEECRGILDEQRNNDGAERDNYLNFDPGHGNGYRQGVEPDSCAFASILKHIKAIFPERKKIIFAEELLYRPRGKFSCSSSSWGYFNDKTNIGVIIRCEYIGSRTMTIPIPF